MIDDVLATLLGAVRGMGPVLRTLIAFVAIFLETSVLLGLVVPGDSVVIIMSTGVQGPLEWVVMIVAVVAGAIGGGSVGYAIGRFFGPRLRDSWLGRRIGRQRIDAAQAFIAQRGGTGVFLSRFLPVLHSVVPLVAGMSGMTYRTFLRWTLPACALWAGAYVSVSAIAAASYTSLAGSLHGAGFIFVGIILVFLLLVWLTKRLLGRQVDKRQASESEADGAEPGATTEADGAEPGAITEPGASGADQPDS